MQLSQPGDVPAWTLADRLRKARDHAKLSQEELAAEIGISRASVSGYEADVLAKRLSLAEITLNAGGPGGEQPPSRA